jgi:hypothetical protein
MIKYVPTDGNWVRTSSITTVCPNRFEELGSIEATVASRLLGIDDPIAVRQVKFLRPVRTTDPESDDEGSESVGRIDEVLVDPRAYPLRWCAIEVQAVYHSGASWNLEFKQVIATEGAYGDAPAGRRHPDFRSSSAKRLLPQLQVKVPTLRRWGKKMAVVVDEEFMNALAPMEHATDLSNCDIAWFVMKYNRIRETGQWSLSMQEPVLTTLENAVTGLTAGLPVALNTFEQRIREKVLREHGHQLPSAR